ncbi:MAG: methyltransferase domain-containing protein [Candidatus Gracilibacteria bacterium]
MQDILSLVALIALTILLPIFAVSLMLPLFMGGPFIPTGRAKVQRMLELANLKKGEKLYDLGAGDGRFVIAGAKLGAKAVGIEINPFQVWWSNLHIALLGLKKNAKVVRANIFTYNISDADVVICYLFPETNKRLAPILQKMLKPGTRVVTHLFRFHGWKLEATDEKAHLYVYKIS